ncbi:MAG: PHP domain-containing protein [Clostridiales bacterium]|nr:PHP domain-containing protein [Clostridiales bacterium]
MKRIDLHVHTTASDSTASPAEAVRLAKEAGLSAIAITDHDTVSGYAEAAEAGKKYGVEVVPGIEISTKYGRAVHILGYYIDPDSDKLAPVLEWVVHDRDERNRKMAELMAADGLPVSYEEMHRRFGAVIGRPHFAEVLVELGLAKDIRDAFDRYVEKGQKYYLPRNFLSIERSIEIIREAGGVPVLAHPFQYKLDDAGLRELIEHCMESGLQGMECRYSGYSVEQSKYLGRLAEEYGLIKTGGSDFHGDNKKHISIGTGTGHLEVPYKYLEKLRQAAGK